MFENLLTWQMDYLVYLQNFRELTGGIFNDLFLFITTLGEKNIPMFLICTFYWCINKKIGAFMLLNYMFIFVINTIIKTSACIYRPWILDERIKPVGDAFHMATSYSFPSGHTASAVSVWGALALKLWNKHWIRYTCIIIILLVGLSRNYLGVHTPQDVIVSLILGTIMLLSINKALTWIDNGKNRDLILILVITFISLFTLIYVNLKSYPVNYVNGTLLFNPTSVKISTFAIMGGIIGTFWGWLFEKRFIGFEPHIGLIKEKITRLIIGLLCLIVYLKKVEPLMINILGQRFGLFVAYFIMGLFIACIYPYLIKRYTKIK